MIVLVVTLLAMAVGAAIALGLGMSWKQGSGMVKSPIALFVGIIVILGAIFVIPASVGTVEAGERGVVLEFGAVTDRTLDEGLYFIKPYINSVEIMSVQTVAFIVTAGAASKDLQVVTTEVTLNYSLNPSRVNDIYQRLRKDYESRIVSPATQEAIKAGTAEFTAEQLVTQRPLVKTNIEERMRVRLEQNGMILDTLQLTDFQFSDAFNQAVEAKVRAEQAALEAENRLDQIEVEARQAKQFAEGERDAAIARAEGQRQAVILEARGEAESIKLRSEAQAKANNVIAESLTADVITYEAVQRLSPGIQTIILPAGQEFIFGEGFLGRK